MTVPSRPERHREIKQIKWKLNWLQKHSNLQKLLKDEALGKITEEDRVLMVKGDHEDKALQEKFRHICSIIQESYNLEERLQYLKVGFRTETTQESNGKVCPDSPPEEVAPPLS